MEVWYHILGWGSPVGLGIFILLICAGLGTMFTGIARLKEQERKSLQ